MILFCFYSRQADQVLGMGSFAPFSEVSDRLVKELLSHFPEATQRPYSIVSDGLRRRIDGGAMEDMSHIIPNGPSLIQASTLHDEIPLLLADKAENICNSGEMVTWANFHPEILRSGIRTFQNHMMGRTEIFPELNEDLRVNCCEIFYHLGISSGMMPKRYIDYLKDMYRTNFDFESGTFIDEHHANDYNSKVWNALLPHERTEFFPDDPASPKPKRGDLIVWGSPFGVVQHAAMATGNVVDGSPEVLSCFHVPANLATVDYRDPLPSDIKPDDVGARIDWKGTTSSQYTLPKGSSSPNHGVATTKVPAFQLTTMRNLAFYIKFRPQINEYGVIDCFKYPPGIDLPNPPIFFGRGPW